jgi:nicotinamide mononucleotide transporter
LGDFVRGVADTALQLSGWEALAVVLAVAYLLLAVRESLWCWYCALASTAIYTVLFWNVSLLMESALNVFYMAMAVYGWWQWRRGGGEHRGVAIHRWPLRIHLALLAGIAVLTLASGYFLSTRTQAAWPYLDSFTTWASVITTFMVAKKILENWFYWFVIDSTSVFLYLDRDMPLTAVLFIVYVVLVVCGYVTWRRHEKREQKERREQREQQGQLRPA